MLFYRLSHLCHVIGNKKNFACLLLLLFIGLVCYGRPIKHDGEQPEVNANSLEKGNYNFNWFLHIIFVHTSRHMYYNIHINGDGKNVNFYPYIQKLSKFGADPISLIEHHA